MGGQGREAGSTGPAEPAGRLLAFRGDGAADPRLRALVRLLARQAADELFDGAAAKPEETSPG